MGSIYSRLNSPLSSCSGSVTEIITGRKRKHDEIDSDASDTISKTFGNAFNTPIKKKLQTTAQYIYKTFYVEEQNSDVSVMALGKVWHLHKIYLCQSPYFASMFNGTWRECDQNFIPIEIIDPKIDLESLNIVFGSLYLDEVTLDPRTVISVLATSALLQLDGLIDKCAEVMNSTVNADTAIVYHIAAVQYGTKDVKNTTFNWLLINLLSFYSKHCKWLQLINADLLTELVKSPDLVVMQTEFALYALLKLWIFLKLHPNFFGDEDIANRSNEVMSQYAVYFEGLQNKQAFLLTKEGEAFTKPFRNLRLQHLINHPVDIKIILADNIIPREWLYEPFMMQWHSLIKIDNSADFGPVDCSANIFYESCLRCGRILEDDGFQKWRWTGFNFGVDLVLISDVRTLSMKRHHRTENERLLSLQSKRNIMLRVSIFSLNKQRQVLHSQTTGLKSIQLDRNEESRLLILDPKLTYPILISVNLLVTTPNRRPPTILETINSDSVCETSTEISTISSTQSILSNININNNNNNITNNNDDATIPTVAQSENNIGIN